MRTPLVKAENIRKWYQIGKVVTKAVDGVSLEVHEGDFMAIVGRSGSGKSTLLYQLSLLDKPTDGLVFVGEDNTSMYGRKERTQLRLNTFGYVFQDYALVPELTALENVVLPLMMSNSKDHSSYKGVTEDLLARVGLGDRLHNLPSQLSGGEQQRVAIARALVNDPKILFADEPTANLDSETSELVMNTFRELHADGLTIVMVTHEPEYMDIGTRKVELKDGRVVEQG